MSIKEDINKLTDNEDAVSKLPEQVPAQTIGPALGVANFDNGENEDGSGIDSPLTETGRTEVEVEIFDEFNIWSIKVKVATSITMTDANDRQVVFEYIEPTP